MTASATSGNYIVTLTVRSDSRDLYPDSRAIGLMLDNGREINYAATAGISDADLAIALTTVAGSLAAQERIAADLAGARFTGTVETASGAHAATLGVLYCMPNTDGLTVTYAPLGSTDSININAGIPTGADDIEAVTATATALLQAAADALAQAKADIADQTQGMVGMTFTGAV